MNNLVPEIVYEGSMEEIMTSWNISRATFYRCINSGKITPTGLGKYRVDEDKMKIKKSRKSVYYIHTPTLLRTNLLPAKVDVDRILTDDEPSRRLIDRRYLLALVNLIHSRQVDVVYIDFKDSVNCKDYNFGDLEQLVKTRKIKLIVLNQGLIKG